MAQSSLCKECAPIAFHTIPYSEYGSIYCGIFSFPDEFETCLQLRVFPRFIGSNGAFNSKRREGLRGGTAALGHFPRHGICGHGRRGDTTPTEIAFNRQTP